MTPKNLATTLHCFAAIATAVLLVSSAQAQSNYQVLHYFDGEPAGYPTLALVADAEGNLYGIAQYDPTPCADTGGGCGSVFKLARDAGGKWKTSVIYTLPGYTSPGDNGPDGGDPMGPLIVDAAGNLYGTTPYLGRNDNGTVFELSPSAHGWVEKTLYNFGLAPDVGSPVGRLVMDANGNLYGTTVGHFGGVAGIFELQRSGDEWTESVIWRYTDDLSWTLTIDGAGNLYASGVASGSYGYGSVYELTPSGDGGWTETVLYSFTGGAGGTYPYSVILDAAGNLYGTTLFGGDNVAEPGPKQAGCGTVFELSPSSGSWTYKLLHTFTCFAYFPIGVLTLDAAGNLYGTTEYGGENNGGFVYELSPSDGEWTYTLLHGFCPASGENPIAGLILDKGVLYGTAAYGGVNYHASFPGTGYGVVFSLTP